MFKVLAMAAVISSQAGATPAPQSTPAPPHCVTRTQINDVSVVTIASLVETVRNACRPHLSATGWLNTAAAADYSARLRAEAQRRLDSAVTAVAAMGPSAGMSPAMIRTMSEQGLHEGAGAELAQFANAEICGDANEIFEISSTLSPDQSGRLFGAFASLIDHVLRMLPARMFDPAGQPAAPAHGARPEAGASPAAFDLFRTAPPPSVPPVRAMPRTPPRPFMCRGEA